MQFRLFGEGFLGLLNHIAGSTASYIAAVLVSSVTSLYFILFPGNLL